MASPFSTKLVSAGTLTTMRKDYTSSLGSVHTDPAKKVARFHLAFTWDGQNWMNFWPTKFASLGPAQITI